jgi:hypothetical protein
MNDTTIKFEYEAGLLVRSSFRRNLKSLCFKCNVALELEEEKGWLSSTFLIKMTGNDAVVRGIVKVIREMDNE